MEKRMNGTWLIFVLVAVIAAVILFWIYTSRAAGSYNGGILVELPAKAAEQWAGLSGELL